MTELENRIEANEQKLEIIKKLLESSNNQMKFLMKKVKEQEERQQATAEAFVLLKELVEKTLVSKDFS